MKLIIGPVIGALASAPDGSKIAYAVGEVGMLTVHESENRHPGKAFATLYYTPGVDPRSVGQGDFETERFIRTGCGDLERCPSGVLSISGDDGEYLFEVL